MSAILSGQGCCFSAVLVYHTIKGQIASLLSPQMTNNQHSNESNNHSCRGHKHSYQQAKARRAASLCRTPRLCTDELKIRIRIRIRIMIRMVNHDKQITLSSLSSSSPGGRVLPKILDGGVPHGSQNSDPISDQNI